MSAPPRPAGRPPSPTSANPPSDPPATDVTAELLRVAQSVNDLSGMWRLASAGYRLNNGPSQAVLIDMRDWEPEEAGYSPPGPGVHRFGCDPLHLDEFPDPLGVINVTWTDFYDPDEAARWEAKFRAEREAWLAGWQKLWPKNGAVVRSEGGDIRGEPDVRPRIFCCDEGDGEPASSHPETDTGPGDHSGPAAERSGRPVRPTGDARDDDPEEPVPPLMDFLNERVRAAAALVPASRINAPVRPVVTEWFRRRVEANEWGHMGVYAAWLGRQPDRDAALGRLADGYLAAESAEIRFWLLVYATLRGTEHVREYPVPGTGPAEFRGDPAAVIRWPAEALTEVLVRLASEAHEWVGSAGPTPPRPAGRPRGGRRPTNPDGDATVWREWESRCYSSLKELADALGMHVRDVKASLDRERKRAGKTRRQSG